MLELVNSSVQIVDSNEKINLGTVNIKHCDGSVFYNGTDTLEFRKNGIYQILVKANAISTVADQVVEYALAYNGTVSTIAQAEAPTVDIGSIVTLTIPKAIKICNAPLAITLVNSGADTTNYQGIIIDIDRLV